MKSHFTEIRIEGKTIKVPSLSVDDRTIIVTGKWLATASVMDEELVEGAAVSDPHRFLAELEESDARADIFVFAQTLSQNTPRHEYNFDWDNAAVVPITTYKDWWERRLPQETRRNVKRAAKLGVVVRVTPFNDELVHGIVSIYNETPIRQGRRFWHYGKDFEEVKAETATYLDRSEFIGAYLGEELIGFIKLVYVDQSASILHILSKNQHTDKRPTNALIAKAVEICANRRLSYLVYCKYVYGKNDDSPLTEFKRRNGFEQLRYPRYYVPLTLKGKVAVRFGLHRGFTNILPKGLWVALLGIRRRYFELVRRIFRARLSTGEAMIACVSPTRQD